MAPGLMPGAAGLREANAPPLEVIPSPNVLEEMFVQALEAAHALHDIHYRHWKAGIRHLASPRRDRRRRVARLPAEQVGALPRRALLAGRLVYVAVLFAIGQLLVADSIIVKWAPIWRELQLFVAGFDGLAGTASGDFRARGGEPPVLPVRHVLAPAGLIAVALTIPHLITRDLASNAIVVYASKAITRFDYVLARRASFWDADPHWLGPVLAAWLVGNLMAPNWNFFWHSRLGVV